MIIHHSQENLLINETNTSGGGQDDGPAVPEGREPAAVVEEPSDENCWQWYTYCPEEGLEMYSDRKQAQSAAQSIMGSYEVAAHSDGWHEDMELVSWGMLVPVEQAQVVERKTAEPDDEFDEWVKYELRTVRWGHQPAPPAEGEVAELAAKLRRLAPYNPLGTADPTITRAAELLQQQHPAPAGHAVADWFDGHNCSGAADLIREHLQDQPAGDAVPHNRPDTSLRIAQDKEADGPAVPEGREPASVNQQSTDTRATGGWQPIETAPKGSVMHWKTIDTAPRNGKFFIGGNLEEVITCNWPKQKNIDYAPGNWRWGRGEWNGSMIQTRLPLTHWMQLPELPTSCPPPPTPFLQ